MMNVQSIGEAVRHSPFSICPVLLRGRLSIREHDAALRKFSHPRKSKHACRLNKIHAGIMKVSQLSLLLLVCL